MSGSPRFARLEKGHLLEFPSERLRALDACSPAEPSEKLRARLQSQGYLFIRQCLDRQAVLTARETILDFMEAQEKDQKIFEDRSRGILDVHCGRHCVPRLENVSDITRKDEVLAVLESEQLFRIFHGLFGEPARSFDYKWLRAMYMKGFTGAHLDIVYMGRGTHRTLTCWIPFGDVPVEMGGLAIVPESNHAPNFARLRETYGRTDLDAIGFKGSGWFTEDAEEMTRLFGARWATADFRAGDVLIFTLHTAHMSLTNQTQIARISCDTRWFPGDEAPDPRFVGNSPVVQLKYGDHSHANSLGITIEELKKKWNLQNVA